MERSEEIQKNKGFTQDHNALDEAYEVFHAGLKKPPANFDMLFNFACLKDKQGQYLQAFDLYKSAFQLTQDRSNQKEILLALERIQIVMKKNVQRAKNEAIPNANQGIGQRIPFGAEATEHTTVIDLDISKCMDPYAFGFGEHSWNPYVELVHEITENPELQYIESVLKRFYYLFQPGTLQDALGIKNGANNSPIHTSWNPYPWGYVQHEGKLDKITNKEHPLYSIYPDKIGIEQMQELVDQYELLQETGYHPAAFEEDFIKGYLLKNYNDYRFIVCEGNYRMAVLAALGYKKVRCHIRKDKRSIGVVDIVNIDQWPMVKNNNYSKNAAKQVFQIFFDHSGKERAFEHQLLCKNLDPEKENIFKKIGVNMKNNTNINFYNAGWLDKIDEEFANEVREFWQDHYGKKIDPGLHLAHMNLTGKKDVRLVPHEVMKYDIIPLSNQKEMYLFAYNDKNIYDKLIPTSRKPYTIVKRVCGKYFDENNNCLKQDEAYEIIKQENRELIIKPSTTNDGIGISKLAVQSGVVYRGEKIITMQDIEKEWNNDFLVQEVILQHPVLAKPHPDSVNALRMVTYRWENKIKNLMTVAFFGGEGRIQNNVDSIGCGVTDNGELFDYAIGKKGQIYTHHPSTNYNFSDYARIPNYDRFKKFVRDLHKEVLHHDYICWDIIVGEDGEPIFLELNFWGTTWVYQLTNETSFFGDDTEKVLEYMAKKRATQSP